MNRVAFFGSCLLLVAFGGIFIDAREQLHVTRAFTSDTSEIQTVADIRSSCVCLKAGIATQTSETPIPPGGALPIELTPNYITPYDISRCCYIMRRDVFRRETLSRGRGDACVPNEQCNVEILNVTGDFSEGYALCGNKKRCFFASCGNNMVYSLLKGALS